jgi:UDP-N-acetylmuramate dehydrogenase
VDQVLKSYLEYICGKDNIEENVPMRTRTTIKTGGPARFFISAKSKEILLKLTCALDYIEYPYRIIGAGSNLLVDDRGYDGIIIKPAFREIVDNQLFIYADAGAGISTTARFARDRCLSGFEFAVGIPGTIGGAVFMNAGAFGGRISDIVTMVDVLFNGEIISLDAKDCKFSYRKSIFQKKREYIILGAYFFLKKDNPDRISEREKQNIEKRRAAQSREPSAGSVFLNPTVDGVKISAGKLIDGLGLKGTRIGGAVISEKNAGQILNRSGATSKDIKRLINFIKKKVRAEYGITLRTEIEILRYNRHSQADKKPT